MSVKAKLFRGFSDPSRLAIVEALRDRPMNVSQVVKATSLSQPSASMHLDCLYCCGIVDRETRGRFRWYSLRPRQVAKLLVVADGLLEEVADRIESCGNFRRDGTGQTEPDRGSRKV